MSVSSDHPGLRPAAGPRVVMAQAGGQTFTYRHAAAARAAGRLDRFVTSAWYDPARWPDRLLAGWPRADRYLRRRTLPELSGARVVRRPHLELPEVLARAAFGINPLAQGLMLRRDAAFDRFVARRHAAAGDLFWGFQGGCRDSLRAARSAGVPAVAEFTTAHVTAAVRILGEEAERHPEWAPTITNLHFPDWYRERLEAEPHAADLCVAASSFTVRSLTEVGVPADRVRVVPLGADLSAFSPGEPRPAGRRGFRVLFVGGVGQRKGVKYLLEAYAKVCGTDTELVLCGPPPADLSPLKPHAGRVTLTGRVDRAEVVRQMRAADVLVLPSVFEGFGLVIPEAMACGLPVIASTHSCGPEVIREGVDGFVLAPDDVDGLAAKLADLMSRPDRAAELGRNAVERAAGVSWAAHAAGLNAVLDEFVTPAAVPLRAAA